MKLYDERSYCQILPWPGSYTSRVTGACAVTTGVATTTYDNYGNMQVTDEYSSETDLKRRTYQYVYPNTTAWIVNQVGRVLVYDETTAPHTLVSETRSFFDGAADLATPPTDGNVTRVDVRQDASTLFTQATYQYDGYGNRTHVTDANNHTTVTGYDTTYHLYPYTVTNAKNQTTTTVTDVRYGRPSSASTRAHRPTRSTPPPAMATTRWTGSRR